MFAAFHFYTHLLHFKALCVGSTLNRWYMHAFMTNRPRPGSEIRVNISV